MRQRSCSGGIVFDGDRVLLMKTIRLEWIFPKAEVRGSDRAAMVAREAVRSLAGVETRILDQAGRTSYEHYSISEQRPIRTEVDWFLMLLEGEAGQASFFPVEEALVRLTYSQEKSLLMFAYQRYCEILPVQ
ncbi:MAG: NUDIX hydrolase [Bacillota bacterium]|nr:NUDIX hydrolase [Bacillota bacterium]